MKRRDFLQNTLAAGAATLIFPKGLSAATSKNSTLQIAQIGCGRMGRGDMKNALARGWRSEVNARVVAVCDVDRWRANSAKDLVEKFYKEKGESVVDVKVYEDARELIARDDIDAFVISTPENWHGLIGVAAAAAGKHMYMQKPLTYSIPEGQALVKAVRENNVVLQTGSQQRSSVYFRQVCTIIRNNWLGKLKSIEVQVGQDKGTASGEPGNPPADLNYDLWLGPSQEMPYIESRVHKNRGFGRPGWLQVERFCLGMVTGWGSHMYDIAQWGVGNDDSSGPVKIQAKGEFPDRGLFDVHTFYEGNAEYANGVTMTSKAVGQSGVKFITEDGWAYCSRGKMDCSNKELLRRRTSAGEVELYTSKSHMQDFLVSAREGSDPVCPVEVGHRSNTVCVLHHISMKLGGRQLNWDPKTEQIIGDPEATKMMEFAMRSPYSLG